MSLIATTLPRSKFSSLDAEKEGVRNAVGTYKPEYFLNRELSWLKFNWRVLNEAHDTRTPLLDQVKFLAIVSSNLDEFCMKRIGGLRLQLDAGVTKLTVDGRSPAEQITLCAQEMKKLGQAKEDAFKATMGKLEKNGIYIKNYSALSRRDREAMRDYYIANVHPLITPQAIDISHPFPFVSNLSLNLFITLKKPGKRKTTNARIKVPVGAGVPRFVQLSLGKRYARASYVKLEDIMAHNLDLLFPGMDIVSCDVFRITRNANTLADHSGASDLIEMIKAHLRDRKFAPVVRLQLSPTMCAKQVRILIKNLGIDNVRTIISKVELAGMSDLMELAFLERSNLRSVPHAGVKTSLLCTDADIFTQISEHESILLQHPYERFETSVERFAKEASLDPNVKAIKMTIYRTSTDTGIVNHLIRAAKNGKQVAVVVELTASFDESANIEWARKLEQAGIHVSYGIYGLKTHCKVILVVRKEQDGLRRYAHVSTGNYHAKNAKIYSDYGMLTNDPNLTSDLSELFNYLTTGCAPLRKYKRLLTAPLYIKKALIRKIKREADFAKAGKPALIRLKANALEDPDITAALYSASQAGVKIKLLIRDICRLRPGIKGISDNISVISIVGQFLEHGRIYHFHNGGQDEYFIGSADLMTRNLERRVEILIPINNMLACAQLDWVLNAQINDPRSAWDMLGNGDYVQRKPKNDARKESSQELAIQKVRIAWNKIDTQSVYTLKETTHG